ncbi:MAG: hypothetical protein GY765_21670, partial [bacterium]|nr:hypothetical protein [bacterium]
MNVKKIGPKVVFIILICFIFRQAMTYGTEASSHAPTKESLKKKTLQTRGNLFDLLNRLVSIDDSEEIRKFASLYMKFYHRQPELSVDSLITIYDNYKDYNVMVDYIEKLPIHNPITVEQLFAKAKYRDWKNKKERELFISIFQSLLEILSHAAKYGPDRYDYDRLASKLTEIPVSGAACYDKVFEYLKTELGVETGLMVNGEPGSKTILDFVLEGVNNHFLNFDSVDYKFALKDAFKNNIRSILESQEACSFEGLLELNQRFDLLLSGKANNAALEDAAQRLRELLMELPYSDISREAPQHIRERVINYSRPLFNKDLGDLERMIAKKKITPNVRERIEKIKSDYLLHQLKHHLLSLAYALNGKSSRLKTFNNPNLVKLHNFSNQKGRTPWNYSGLPTPGDQFSTYHFCGGLSRLNMSFASKWRDQLLGNINLYNPTQLQAVIINLLDFYPASEFSHSITYNALLLDFAKEIMAKARDYDALKEIMITELGAITGGYHYRRTVDYLYGKADKPLLFYSETRQLGEALLKKEKFLDFYTGKEQLLTFTRQPLAGILEYQTHR